MKKKKLNKVDIYLLISVLILLTYTIATIILVKTYPLSDSQVLNTLTTCVYGTFGLEIASCCVIKSLNIRNERFQNNPENGGVG